MLETLNLHLVGKYIFLCGESILFFEMLFNDYNANEEIYLFTHMSRNPLGVVL